MRYIKVKLGIDLQVPNICDDWWIVIDSSSQRKFSKHVIVILPGESFFQNNELVGQFVDSFCEDLKNDALLDQDFMVIPDTVQKLRNLFF